MLHPTGLWVRRVFQATQGVCEVREMVWIPAKLSRRTFAHAKQLIANGDVVSAEVRAAQHTSYLDSEQATAHLHGMVDGKSG